MPQNDLTAFLITWRTYGTWLPGDERGWVDERRNGRGEPTHGADYRLENAAKGQMKAARVILTDAQRQAVDDAVRAACTEKGWVLHAVNVRTNHVHVVVNTNSPPERTQVALKAAAERGHGVVVLVGDEPYYGPLGFSMIAQGQISMPRPVDPRRLLAHEIVPGALAELSGEMKHADLAR